MFHDHGCATEAVHRHVESQWRRVVQRRGREIHRLLIEAEDKLRQHEQTRRGAERLGLVNERDAFGATCGAAGIQHVSAFEALCQRLVRLRRDSAFV